MVRNFRSGLKWLPGTVVERTGPLSYRVQGAGDRIWRSRHVDHLLQSMDTPQRVSLENPAEPCPLESDPSLPVPPPDRETSPSAQVNPELNPESPSTPGGSSLDESFTGKQWNRSAIEL